MTGRKDGGEKRRRKGKATGLHNKKNFSSAITALRKAHPINLGD